MKVKYFIDINGFRYTICYQKGWYVATPKHQWFFSRIVEISEIKRRILEEYPKATITSIKMEKA
jgi:hypothetical protein